jgi:hypothetical protein
MRVRDEVTARCPSHRRAINGALATSNASGRHVFENPDPPCAAFIVALKRPGAQRKKNRLERAALRLAKLVIDACQLGEHIKTSVGPIISAEIKSRSEILSSMPGGSMGTGEWSGITGPSCNYIWVYSKAYRMLFPVSPAPPPVGRSVGSGEKVNAFWGYICAYMPGIFFFFQILNRKCHIVFSKIVKFSWKSDGSGIFYFEDSIFDRHQGRSGRGNRESNSVGLIRIRLRRRHQISCLTISSSSYPQFQLPPTPA